MPRPAPCRGAAAIARTCKFRILPYDVEVGFEDESLGPLVESLAVTDEQPRDAVSTVHYQVVGDGPYVVLEEGDRLAAGVSNLDAVALLAARVRARVVDHLTVGSWVAVRGGVARVAGRRVLLVPAADADVDLGEVLSPLRRGGHPVEGDDLVFLRDGVAVCLPRPCSSDVQLAPVDVVVVLGRGAQGEAAPMSALDAVQALVAVAVPLWAPPRQVVRACSAIVAGADAYRVASSDVGLRCRGIQPDGGG